MKSFLKFLIFSLFVTQASGSLLDASKKRKLDASPLSNKKDKKGGEGGEDCQLAEKSSDQDLDVLLGSVEQPSSSASQSSSLEIPLSSEDRRVDERKEEQFALVPVEDEKSVSLIGTSESSVQLKRAIDQLRGQISLKKGITQEQLSFLAENADPATGDNVLHILAVVNASQAIDYLLDTGKFEVNRVNKKGLNPLGMAIISGGLEAAMILVEKHNASLMLPRQGQDTLLLALLEKMPCVLRSITKKGNLLIYTHRTEQGKDIFAFVKEQRSIEDLAIGDFLAENLLENLVIEDKEEAKQLILDQPAQEYKLLGAAKEEKYIRSLLSKLVDSMYLYYVQRIALKDEDKNIETMLNSLSNCYEEKTQSTALHYLAIYGIDDLTVLKKILETKKFNVNALDQEGYSPVMRAIEHKRTAMVTCFLQAGAKLTNSRFLHSNLLDLIVKKSDCSIIHALTKNRYVVYLLRNVHGKNIFQVVKELVELDDRWLKILIYNLRTSVRDVRGKKEFLASFVSGLEIPSLLFDQEIENRELQGAVVPHSPSILSFLSSLLSSLVGE